MRPNKFVLVATLAIWFSFFLSEKIGDYLSLKILLSLNPDLMAAAMQNIGQNFVEMMRKPGLVTLGSVALAIFVKWSFALLVSYACAIALSRVVTRSAYGESSDSIVPAESSRP